MTGSSPPSRPPWREGIFRWRPAGLVVLALGFVALEPITAFVMVGPLASDAATVGLIVSAALWYLALTHIAVEWLTSVLGRPRVLRAALVGWAVLEIGRTHASSPMMLMFLGLQIGLCESVAWAALAARLVSNAKHVSPCFPGGVR